jgi:hypothetical protein
VALLQVRRRLDVLTGGIVTHGVAALFAASAIWIAFTSAARVFGGLYPLSVFAYGRYRGLGFALLVGGCIMLTIFTLFRLVAVSPTLPYYLTP